MNPIESKMFTDKMLVRLIIPLVIEQMLAILVGICDGVMVSSVGEAAISGVSLVDMINNVVLNLFAALATGGAVVASQYLGARKRGEAQRASSQLVTMSLIFGVAIMAACLAFGRNMMELFYGGIDDDVMTAGMVYFRITALSYPFIALYNAGAAIFRSEGNSRLSMKVSILMNVINVAGNAICIYGLGMGVAGVAIPTLISRAVAAAVILWMVARSDHDLRVQLREMLPLQKRLVKSILNIGVPSGFENSLFQLGRVVVVSMIAVFGTVQTSANAVANNVDGLGLMFGQAVGLAMITVVGQCVGAGDARQVEYYTKKLMLWAQAALGLSCITILIFVDQLVGLYSSLTPETVALSRKLVMIHCGYSIVLWPASFVLPNALRAANDARFTMLVSVFSMLTMRVAFSWVLCVKLGYGAVGVWYAMVMDWVLRVIFFVTRIASGKWKSKCGLA